MLLSHSCYVVVPREQYTAEVLAYFLWEMFSIHYVVYDDDDDDDNDDDNDDDDDNGNKPETYSSSSHMFVEYNFEVSLP
jgi:hypothetical protein